MFLSNYQLYYGGGLNRMSPKTSQAVERRNIRFELHNNYIQTALPQTSRSIFGSRKGSVKNEYRNQLLQTERPQTQILMPKSTQLSPVSKNHHHNQRQNRLLISAQDYNDNSYAPSMNYVPPLKFTKLFNNIMYEDKSLGSEKRVKMRSSLEAKRHVKNVEIEESDSSFTENSHVPSLKSHNNRKMLDPIRKVSQITRVDMNKNRMSESHNSGSNHEKQSNNNLFTRKLTSFNQYKTNYRDFLTDFKFDISAKQIQRCWKGYLGRKFYKIALLNYDKHYTRSRVNLLLGDIESSINQRIDHNRMLNEHNIVKMQSHWRGYVAKKYYKSLKPLRFFLKKMNKLREAKRRLHAVSFLARLDKNMKLRMQEEKSRAIEMKKKETIDRLHNTKGSYIASKFKAVNSLKPNTPLNKTSTKSITPGNQNAKSSSNIMPVELTRTEKFNKMKDEKPLLIAIVEHNKGILKDMSEIHYSIKAYNKRVRLIKKKFAEDRPKMSISFKKKKVKTKEDKLRAQYSKVFFGKEFQLEILAKVIQKKQLTRSFQVNRKLEKMYDHDDKKDTFLDKSFDSSYKTLKLKIEQPIHKIQNKRLTQVIAQNKQLSAKLKRRNNFMISSRIPMQANDDVIEHFKIEDNNFDDNNEINDTSSITNSRQGGGSASEYNSDINVDRFQSS